uniref:Uncharacterized protein n=1 Tax=Anguilla anguilla TaxID=7936 RepID=A0A0E9Q2Y8_ANGAN
MLLHNRETEGSFEIPTWLHRCNHRYRLLSRISLLGRWIQVLNCKFINAQDRE